MRKKRTRKSFDPTQAAFILEYYKVRPYQEIPNSEAAAWAQPLYFEKTGKRFEDTGRTIRSLSDRNLLIKVRKGVYKYDPEAIINEPLSDFSASVKQQIFEKYNYRCAVCGRGEEDGLTIHIDHKKSRFDGGTSEFENGQVLCSVHNYRKKTFSTFEFAKRLFIDWHETAVKNNDKMMQEFCQKILELYDSYEIDTHIQMSQQDDLPE